MQGGDASQAARANAALPFVRKWIRTQQAIVFRLSTGVVQLNFFDHCKVILNTPARLVTFIDHSKVSRTYTLDAVAASRHPADADLAARLGAVLEAVGFLQGPVANGATC